MLIVRQMLGFVPELSEDLKELVARRLLHHNHHAVSIPRTSTAIGSLRACAPLPYLRVLPTSTTFSCRELCFEGLVEESRCLSAKSYYPIKVKGCSSVAGEYQSP